MFRLKSKFNFYTTVVALGMAFLPLVSYAESGMIPLPPPSGGRGWFDAESVVISNLSDPMRAEEIFAPLKADKISIFGGISNREIKRRLLQNPWIEDVDLEWTFSPITLHIRVSEAKPWMVAELPTGAWLVSKSGNLVIPLSSIEDDRLSFAISQLPHLIGVTKEGGADRSEDKFLAEAIEQIKHLQEIGFPFDVEAYRIEDDGSLTLSPVDLQSNPQVRLYSRNASEARDARDRVSAIVKDLQTRDSGSVLVDIHLDGKGLVSPAKLEAF